MYSLLFALMAIANFSYAQTSVVTIPLPGYDPQPLVASIIGSDATATTYLIQCTPGTDDDECGIPMPVTVTEGPAIAAVTYPAEYETTNGSVPLAFTAFQSCSLDGTISAVCVESNGGFEANFPGMSTVTYTGTDMGFMPVTVTAAAVASNTAASSTAVSSTVAPSTTAMQSVSAKQTSSVSQTTTQNTSKSTAVITGGALAVTRPAILAVGGAALAMIVLG